MTEQKKYPDLGEWCVELERMVADRDAALAEARAEIERLRGELIEAAKWETAHAELAVHNARAADAASRREARLEAQLAEAREVVGRLPKTADGVRAAPNSDPVWINAGDRAGWQHEGYDCDGPVMATSWAHYGDHIWLGWDGGPDEGDHWFGPFYSTEAAARAAAEQGGGE